LLNSPIPKLSLHNSAAFCLRQKLRRDLLENLTFYSNIYTSIIELYAVCFWIRVNQRYSKASYIFCTEQIMAVLWSLTCTAVILSLLQENNLSNIPHKVKSRTEAVEHLSRFLETWKMLKIILLKVKFIN